VKLGSVHLIDIGALGENETLAERP